METVELEDELDALGVARLPALNAALESVAEAIQITTAAATQAQEAVIALASINDPAGGAAGVGWDGEQVSAQLDQSKKLAGYTALGNYTGTATRIELTQTGIAGTILRDPTVTVGDGGTTFLDGSGRGWRRAFQGDVRVAWFGASASSGVDSTVAVRSAHAAANSLKFRVTYAGLSEVYIQADANIQINTDVDWSGCAVRILSGVAVSPSYATYKTAYVLSDPACPLVDVVLDKALCDLTPCARKPFGTQRDGYAGYYLVETNYKITNRLRTALENYKQSIYLDAEGATALGLSADMTTATTVTAKYRANPASFITLKNLAINPNDFNNQKIFDCQRNLVSFENHKLLDAANLSRDDICALYQISNCDGILFDGLQGKARISPDIGGASLGTYIINPEGCTNLTMRRVNVTGSKSAIGSNNVNGVLLENSTIIRMDVHSSGHNIEANNVKFLDRGIGVGWGGGYIRAINCKLKTNVYPMISDREDYAGTWFSCTMTASDCEIDAYASRRIAFIELSSYKVDQSSPGVGNTLGPTYMPDVITVKDCHRVNNTLVGNLVTQGVRISVASGAVVYAPRIINITRVNGALPGNARFGNRIDLRSMLPHKSGNKSSLTMRDCEGSDAVPNVTNQPEGLTLTTGASNGLTATNACRYDLVVSGIDAVCIETGCTNGRIHIGESTISRVALTSDDTSRQGLFVGAGNSAATPFLRDAETSAPIGCTGGLVPTVYTPTSILGLHISGNFDLSSASVLQGVHIRSGATVVLPATVTAALAFSGWKLGQFQ